MSDSLAPRDSINRRFRYIVTALYLVVVSAAAWLFAIQWNGYWDAYQARNEHRALQAAMRAMANVSTERRPAYAAMAIGGSDDTLRLHTLARARAATDLRMTELGDALHDPRCHSCASLLPQWEEARTRLINARAKLDALAAQPPQLRKDQDILEGFTALSGVIPQLSAIADAGSMGVIRENADVQSYLMAARLAALIREHAGLVASQLAPALIRHRPLTADEGNEIESSLGKIEQLDELLTPTLKVLPPELQSDYLELRKTFLGDGLEFIRKVKIDADHPDEATLTPAQLADRYGPMLEPINRFRDDALALAQQTIQSSLRKHLWLLLGTGLFASLLTGFLLLMIWRFREKVIRPFADARRAILAIAAGHLTVQLPQRRYGREVQELFRALNILKANDTKRLQLELERKRLIGELRTMADTDPLTGLLNRRAFEQRAQVMLADQRGDPLVALIMIDIDHFKRVNDTWGHESGDHALTCLASVCRETVRADDVVARIGGEEFVILLPVREAGQAGVLAEKLRGRLHQETIQSNDGRSFAITASFGVAHATRVGLADVESLLRSADALLYRAKENGRDRVECAESAT